MNNPISIFGLSIAAIGGFVWRFSDGSLAGDMTFGGMVVIGVVLAIAGKALTK